MSSKFKSWYSRWLFLLISVNWNYCSKIYKVNDWFINIKYLLSLLTPYKTAGCSLYTYSNYDQGLPFAMAWLSLTLGALWSSQSLSTPAFLHGLRLTTLFLPPASVFTTPSSFPSTRALYSALKHWGGHVTDPWDTHRRVIKVERWRAGQGSFQDLKLRFTEGENYPEFNQISTRS